MIGDFVLNKILNDEDVSLFDLKNEIGLMNDSESLSFYAFDILAKTRCYVFESCSLSKYLGTEFGSNEIDNLAAAVQHAKEVMSGAEKAANLVIGYNEWKDSV